MSRQPTDLDAILESIRQRMVDPEATPTPLVSPSSSPSDAAPATLAPRPARLVEAPVGAAGSVTIEALFTAVLEPLLRQWIDANMPEIAERVAQAEIRRLTGTP